LIIVFACIQIEIWVQLNFIQVEYKNSMFVYLSDVLLVIANLINLFKLFCFSKLIDQKIMNKINCLFYFSFFGFANNMIQTLFTLFGSYLTYFESKLNH
jgi:hypothetical protein